jgi:3-deoxy-7-phosphoheptulonate synthase
MTQPWYPTSWRTRSAAQIPAFPDSAALAATEVRLASYSPLVFAGEAHKLLTALGEVAEGRAFLQQGGDCPKVFQSMALKFAGLAA